MEIEYPDAMRTSMPCLRSWTPLFAFGHENKAKRDCQLIAVSF